MIILGGRCRRRDTKAADRIPNVNCVLQMEVRAPQESCRLRVRVLRRPISATNSVEFVDCRISSSWLGLELEAAYRPKSGTASSSCGVKVPRFGSAFDWAWSVSSTSFSSADVEGVLEG
jgi:hypothetical protein